MTFPTTQTVSRLGQINNAGDPRATFQKLFSGEVLRAFKGKNIMMPLHRVRTIKSGKSASFPIIGTAKAQYHQVGELIQGQQIGAQERTVTVDDLLISPVFIAKIDEAMNNYDVRQPYSDEAGTAISDLFDKNVLRMACKASFVVDEATASSAGVPSVLGETYTTNIELSAAGDELKGDKLVNAIFAARAELEEKNVGGDPFIVLRPAQYYSLFNAEDVTKLQWINSDVGGSGSFTNAKVPVIAGMTVYTSNNLPSVDESAKLTDPEGLTFPAKYRGDYSRVVGLIMTKDAVCTVKLFDLSTESEYQMTRQGTFMLAKMAVGHNILRPACAITILKKAGK